MNFVDGLMGAIYGNKSYDKIDNIDKTHMTEAQKGNFVNSVNIVTKSLSVSGNRFEAHWRSVCHDYWQGCWTCPDVDLTKRVFCLRHPRPAWTVLQ